MPAVLDRSALLAVLSVLTTTTPTPVPAPELPRSDDQRATKSRHELLWERFTDPAAYDDEDCVVSFGVRLPGKILDNGGL
ncbi:hypothetical protein [Polymorphospora rubra]|uniref:hypothetical protein n=1 Tax=Polymorphospora rubra TaxID=338584 RepID=UPI0033EF13C8